jgi:catechol 2,3-dioxygenase-like lactoylglutathione lyase family enzyme
MDSSPRLDAIGLVVSDMAASLAFYRRLGLDVPAGAGTAPHVEATLPGGTRVLWDTEEVIRSFDPRWTRPRGGDRIGLAFRCASPAEVDATYEALVAAGHRGHLKPWDAVWGQRYAVVLDPDGCGVSLFADAGPDTGAAPDGSAAPEAGAAGDTGTAPEAGSGASDAL